MQLPSSILVYGISVGLEGVNVDISLLFCWAVYRLHCLIGTQPDSLLRGLSRCLLIKLAAV